MKTILNVIVGLIVFAALSSPSYALAVFASADPRSVVQTVIALTDRHALPSWDAPSFSEKLRPYLTPDLLAAVRTGGILAETKGIDLYDGEFFTGAQGLEHAHLFSATVTKMDAGEATVEASIGTSDEPKVQPKAGDRMRFELKRIDGIWKIDDFRNLEPYAKAEPSVKTLFENPVRYGE